MAADAGLGDNNPSAMWMYSKKSNLNGGVYDDYKAKVAVNERIEATG